MVRLGAHDLSVEEEAAEDFTVQRVVIHPGYSREDSVPRHDIAIISLDSDVVVGGAISPVCLPSPAQEMMTGSPVMVAGWGATSEGGLTADRLQEVELVVSDQEACRHTFHNLTEALLGPGTLCAGYDQGGRDACQGDSGGALLHRLSGSYVQVGIVSTGIGCARRDLPGVYTKVSHYSHWIEDVKAQLAERL